MLKLLVRIVLVANLFLNVQIYAQQSPVIYPLGSLALDSSNEWLQRAFDHKISDSVQLIGLGEFTHGGHEVFQMKAKIAQFLVEEKGVRNILFEYPNAALSVVNFYLQESKLKGEDTLRWICLRQFDNSIMDNALLDLLVWIKRYNLAHPDNMVGLKGTDILGASGSFANYFRHNLFFLLDSATQKALDYKWNIVGIDSITRELIAWHNDHKDTVRARLKIHYDDFLYNVKNAEADIAWRASKNNFIQSLNQRDSIVAENIMALQQKKAIFWAHNAHVAATSYFISAGSRLKKELGNGYYVIATDFSEKATIRVLSGPEKNFSPHKKGLTFQLRRSVNASEGIVFYNHLPGTITRKLRISVIGIEGIYKTFESENGFDALIVLGTVTPAVLR
jgi:erythromycin esterase-like protein